MSIQCPFTTTPLYRYYNPTTLDHFTGLNSTPPEGYANEGILLNVFVGYNHRELFALLMMRKETEVMQENH